MLTIGGGKSFLQTEVMDKQKLVKLLIAIAAMLILWFLPDEVFGMENLTVVEHRVIALFVFGALMWILEPIPIWTTSIALIVMMVVTVSDSMFAPLKDTANPLFGQLISHRSIMASFADPIIMLFMGGFALAIGATKVGLDVNLARVLLKPFGNKSEIVLLGFMIVTAVFSMFMSNTATAAMMLAIVAPVIAQLPAEGKGRTAMALGIPIAANVGGIGTPIGTPPNAIAIRYLTEHQELGVHIGFGQWMLAMVPITIIILALAWFLLLKFFPFKKKSISIDIEGRFRTDTQAVIVYVTFAVTVALWLLDSVTGINSNCVAMIPLAVFAVTGVMGRKELQEINWDVLWLVAGGFALGVGLKGSGLAEHMVDSIPFASWPPFIVLLGSGFICYLMSTFMSNTASAALLIPILAAIATGMGDVLTAFGGAETMLIGVALCASLAMALPISTPPNALAYATGVVKQNEMAKVGIVVGIIGMIIGYVMLFVFVRVGVL